MKRGFTLIELIVVIIIVGILAAVGLSQYSTTVEKSRLAEATKRIGIMKQLAYEYYLNNGTMAGIDKDYLGVSDTCAADSYFRYGVSVWPTVVNLYAIRCISGTGGKSPPGALAYNYYMHYTPPGTYYWVCRNPDMSGCFGLPPSGP